MSHLWIKQRIKDVKGLDKNVGKDLQKHDLYMRQVVIFVSTIGDGLAHSQQMIGGQMDERKHDLHAAGVSVYGESDRVFTEAAEDQKDSKKPDASGKKDAPVPTPRARTRKGSK